MSTQHDSGLPSGFTVADGIGDDVEECLALWHTTTTARDGAEQPAGSAERARGRFELPRVAWPVMRDAEGRMAGFALVLAPGCGRPDDDPAAAYLALIGVDPVHQGRGLGHALLAVVSERARAAGHPSLVLHVFPDNVRAVRLYESSGWRPVGEPFAHPLSGRVSQTYTLGL